MIFAMIVAVAAFHLAYAFSAFAWLMLFYLGGLAVLTRARSNRCAFYTGFLVGLGVFVPQLAFLWTLFKFTAVPLWLVLAAWIGAFVWLGRLARLRFGDRWGLLLLPMLWLGLEYFRSELYYLRFSWINAGYAFSDWPGVVVALGGVYGVGFWLMTVAVIWLCPNWSGRKRLAIGLGAAAVMACCLGLAPMLGTPRNGPVPKQVKVAGIQFEFPNESQVLAALDRLTARHPEAELLVLSEYTFDGGVPRTVCDWCREHKRFLIAGGKDDLENKQYYNTAFVVGTNGTVVFKQAKAMPIQFYDDGLPAVEQRVWESPWGKIGICICYDFSFTRVTDELIRQGAQAIIVPTMDIVEWGRHQHQLHARVAPVRAAEYGVPICRVASSGVSQIVSRDGGVSAHAAFPGEGDIIAGDLAFYDATARVARTPIDRVLASLAVAGTLLVATLSLFAALRQKVTQLILKRLQN